MSTRALLLCLCASVGLVGLLGDIHNFGLDGSVTNGNFWPKWRIFPTSQIFGGSLLGVITFDMIQLGYLILGALKKLVPRA